MTEKVDLEKYPYACSECGRDLTPEDCIQVGSVNYCEFHARLRRPHAYQLNLSPEERGKLNKKN